LCRAALSLAFFTLRAGGAGGADNLSLMFVPGAWIGARTVLDGIKMIIKCDRRSSPAAAAAKLRVAGARRPPSLPLTLIFAFLYRSAYPAYKHAIFCNMYMIEHPPPHHHLIHCFSFTYTSSSPSPLNTPIPLLRRSNPAPAPPSSPLLRALPSSPSATTATCEMHPVCRHPSCADTRKKILRSQRPSSFTISSHYSEHFKSIFLT